MRPFMFTLILGTVSFSDAAPVPSPKEPNYFPYLEGATWEYKEKQSNKEESTTSTSKISKVTKKGDTLIVIKESGSIATEFAITPKEIRSYTKDAPTEYNRVVWKVGAKKGDKWEDEYEIGGAVPKLGIPAVKGSTKVVVGDIEEVIVPAGKFKAQLVSSVTVLEGGDPPRKIEAKTWRVDGVGVVKIEGITSGGGLPVQGYCKN